MPTLSILNATSELSKDFVQQVINEAEGDLDCLKVALAGHAEEDEERTEENKRLLKSIEGMGIKRKNIKIVLLKLGKTAVLTME